MIFSGDDIYVESPLSNAVLSNLGDITENITETFKEKLEEKSTDIYDIQQILKNNTTLNSMGRIGKSINKRASKNVSTGKCINQKKIIKTQNLKINSILRNNNSNVLNIKSFNSKAILLISISL